MRRLLIIGCGDVALRLVSPARGRYRICAPARSANRFAALARGRSLPQRVVSISTSGTRSAVSGESLP